MNVETLEYDEFIKLLEVISDSLERPLKTRTDMTIVRFLSVVKGEMDVEKYREHFKPFSPEEVSVLKIHPFMAKVYLRCCRESQKL
jgi:hypothetical protein